MDVLVQLVLMFGFCAGCVFLIIYGAVSGNGEIMALGYTPLISAGTGLVTYYFGKKTGETAVLKALNKI